ncbi:MAG TPA: universal stress protein [Flexivirga sp.]|uniref:universal stress protein n=1 Tax=Flexivirga sp. TaxID=1962927 RepID=UPI002C2CA861|nr:universal stress protein [Flexivirga sp.]HWC21900.1 universal stress protein [Flexivirga sp.]
MTVMVAVPDSEEGARAFDAAVREAAERKTGLVVVNLTLGAVDLGVVPEGMSCEVVGRKGRGDRDPADTVLQALRARPDVDRLVIGVARRSPVGKFILGSTSQRLILEAEVPVLAVKRPNA